MIELKTGNLLEADVEALVNTVNTVGIMGKGIALQFRQAFPENYEVYRKACAKNEFEIGQVLVVPLASLTNPRYIVNFPTKRHWKGSSRMSDIDEGLHALVAAVRQYQIESIAVPPLGCGNGGLDWQQVRPRIEAAFAELPKVRVELYVPIGAPEPEKIQVRTQRPNWTPGRATLVGLLETYADPGYKLTLLEVQKLMYLLQECGQPLKLNYVKGEFGPYTEQLHPVLQRIEGHFVRGYGDRSRSTPIWLLPGAADEARKALENAPETNERMERVRALISGFETPYGMELLTTTHWVATRECAVAARDLDVVIERFHAWNQRKRKLFQASHIRVAWDRLRDEGWL